MPSAAAPLGGQLLALLSCRQAAGLAESSCWSLEPPSTTSISLSAWGHPTCRRLQAPSTKHGCGGGCWLGSWSISWLERRSSHVLVDGQRQGLVASFWTLDPVILTRSACAWVVWMLGWQPVRHALSSVQINCHSFGRSPTPHLQGILTWVQDACPGAYQPRVQYVTVAGRYIQGAPLLGGDGTWQQRVVGAGYQQVR